MSVYVENMSFIEKNNPDLYRILAEKLDSPNEPGDYAPSLCINKTGGLNIKIQRNGNEFYIHSNYNPQTESERWAGAVDADCDLVVVLGLGLGYHIEALLKRIKKHTRVCIIEPDIKVLRLFLENRSISQIFDNRVILVINKSVASIAVEIYDIFKNKLLSKLDFKLYSNYSIIYGNFFIEVQKKLSEIINTLNVNVATSEYFKELWTLNFLVNSIYMPEAANGKDMCNLFKGVPAVIVSAGPSLDKNVHFLKEIKDKAVIIAGGSAIGILNKNNIKPHFMFAIDGDPKEKVVFENIDFGGVSLAYINRLYYEIPKAFTGRKFVFIDKQDKLSAYYCKHMGIDSHELEPDQTVAGFNIGFATHLGCNPIIFVGQDLAYTNLQMHAEGAADMTNFEEEFDNGSKRFIKIKDIYGNDTYTIKQFLTARMSMELKISLAMAEGHNFINATEGGIGLSHCPNINLEEVIDQYMGNTYEINKVIEDNYEKGLLKITNERIKEFHNVIDENIGKMKEVSLELNEDCNKLKKVLMSKNNFDNDKYSRLAVKVNNMQAWIENSDFYKDFLLGPLEQTLAIHKMIMEKELDRVEEGIAKNLARIKFITNQAVEIIGICNFIKSVREEYMSLLL